ncbi:uncharacterized protein involved in exopolysaccharide biosynthesis [Sphingomonas insulae]|uniref:Lipopolysaccharide biosynthesis protein n=1 Tax=Sphingomonas insulae TaxID=424800 RepID=A0ABN1HTM5_9SPHN|nr:hypothetical protein [Sphingomonas insulae]NIJ28140.1 uncharacterized protein involved in exopolysaccharide biosynthesis [Sphingomonas insulae]
MLDFTTSAQALEPPPARAQFALRDLLNGLFYYRRVALIVAGVIVALGVLAAVLMPANYSAEARLLPLSTGIYDMQDAGGAPQPGQVLDPAAVANVELQMLGSLELHRSVVRAQLPQNASTADVNAALERFESHLHVTKANDANVIELTYTARDPRQAADTLHQLITRYFETRANVLTSGRVAFLEQQRDAIRRQLDAANAKIVTYQRDNGIVDIAAQVAGAVAQDDLLRKNKLDADASLADASRSLTSLRADTRGIPANVELYSDNTEAARALGEMQASLLTLQAKRADLASRFMKGSPQVTQIDRQIANVQTTIDQQKRTLVQTRRTGRNQLFDTTRDRMVQTQASVAGTQARGAALAAQLAASKARLDQLNGISDQLTAMKLERDVLSDSYKSLAGQVGQARVQLNQASDAGSPSVRIIEAPTPPAKRNNPPLLLIAGSIVAAILIAGTTVFVLGSMREVFLSPIEVERALDVTVLSAPLPPVDGMPSLEHRDYSRMIGVLDAIGGNAGRAVLLVAPTSKMSLQDAALGLGRAIGRRSRGSVILIRFADNGDLPPDAGQLHIQQFEGMATGVISTAACSGQRLDTRLIAELKTRYAYVIVTAPPVAEGFEGIELALSVDAVVPVIEAEATRRPVARNMLTQLRDAGAHVLGAVLLGRKSHIPQWVYRLVIERNLRPIRA